MNPFTIHREGFRDLEDIKKGIGLLSPHAPEIHIGDSLPGRISEGEALLHPDIIRILKLIRQKMLSPVIQINTNGTMFTKSFIKKIASFKPLSFTISYHSHDRRHWSKIFGLEEDKYEIARDSFLILRKEGFIVDGSMVPLPNLAGYPDIENTVKSLRPFIRSLTVYAPGYSMKAPAPLRKILNTDLIELSRFFIKMRKKYSMNIIFYPDLLGPLMNFNPYMLMMRTVNAKYFSVLWLFSEAAYERAEKILMTNNRIVPNCHYAYMVKNHTYGGNIICSGLLMVRDFRKAIKKALKKYRTKKIDLIILPHDSFDGFGNDLMGEHHSRLFVEFGIPVWNKGLYDPA